MKELYINISVVTWVVSIIFIVFILYYVYYVSNVSNASNTLSNNKNIYRWKNYDEFNVNANANAEKNTNIWHGLNSSGNYRGYGREYGGPNTPRYVYGYTN